MSDRMLIFLMKFSYGQGPAKVLQFIMVMLTYLSKVSGFIQFSFKSQLLFHLVREYSVFHLNNPNRKGPQTQLHSLYVIVYLVTRTDVV